MGDFTAGSITFAFGLSGIPAEGTSNEAPVVPPLTKLIRLARSVFEESQKEGVRFPWTAASLSVKFGVSNPARC